MSKDWRGRKVAIVTGGASGLGEGLSRRFVAEGAKVLIADVDEDARRDPGDDMRRERPVSSGRRGRHRPGERAGDRGGERFGGLHVMVNNAGVSGTMHRAPPATTTSRTSTR